MDRSDVKPTRRLEAVKNNANNGSHGVRSAAQAGFHLNPHTSSLIDANRQTLHANTLFNELSTEIENFINDKDAKSTDFFPFWFMRLEKKIDSFTSMFDRKHPQYDYFIDNLNALRALLYYSAGFSEAAILVFGNKNCIKSLSAEMKDKLEAAQVHAFENSSNLSDSVAESAILCKKLPKHWAAHLQYAKACDVNQDYKTAVNEYSEALTFSGYYNPMVITRDYHLYMKDRLIAAYVNRGFELAGSPDELYSLATAAIGALPQGEEEFYFNTYDFYRRLAALSTWFGDFDFRVDHYLEVLKNDKKDKEALKSVIYCYLGKYECHLHMDQLPEALDSLFLAGFYATSPEFPDMVDDALLETIRLHILQHHSSPNSKSMKELVDSFYRELILGGYHG